MKRLLIALAAVACMAAASDPTERLPDPAQEARARDLFAQIRCVVCQNESIDDSEAELAQDLRRVVREEVAAGRTDEQILDDMVDRYGEFVLLKPTFSPANALLWGLPLALLLGAGGWLLWRARRAPVAEIADAGLTPEEEARLAALTAGGDDGHGFAAPRSSENAQDDRSVS